MEHETISRWIDAATESLEGKFGDINERRVHQTWGDRVVVEVRTSSFPEGVVLKASAEKSVRAEVYAAKCAKDGGVPVPEILAGGEDNRLPGHDWFAMRRAEGRPWQTLIQSDFQRSRTLDDIGQVFAWMHSIPMRDYGPLVPNLGGTYKSWSGWLRAELLICTQPLIQEGHLPPNFMSAADDVLESLVPQLGRVRPSLVHGDLGDEEVFVDPMSGAVTAIVDWGDALSGDPLYDFARFVAGGPVDDERPALYLPGVKRSYAKYTGSDPATLEGRVPDLYGMHNAVRNAFWALREAPSWVEDLCVHARTILSTLTGER